MPEQRIIVTGAASGIGRACARTLLAGGHKVAALDIAEEALKREFEGQSSAVTIRLDAGSPESCKAAIEEAAARLGGLNAFVHFAALWTGTGWEQSDTAEWDRLLSVNLRGSFLLAQAAIPHLRAAGGGSIVLTASDSARVGGVAGGPAYASSKGGVIALTRSLARSLGPSGIRVNALNPGVVDSPMTQSWPRELINQTVSRTPLGRIAQPDDISDVACFLVSHASRFITGEVIEINGGFYFD
jgi:NAD(P)-dependent dehydrogenase (short-subunit alcohol dehydrogenase family)